MSTDEMIVGFDAGTKDRTVYALHGRDGISVIEPPAWAGDVVGIEQYGGDIFVACHRGVFRLQGTKLVPLRFDLLDAQP